MFISAALMRQMADFVLDLLERSGPLHIRTISGRLTHEFQLTRDLDDSEFKGVLRKAKDLGHQRDPAIALLPQKSEAGRTFVGYWTTQPEDEDAIVHSELQIKQVASRAVRDGRSYLLLVEERGNEELRERADVVRLFAISGQMFLDELRGELRSSQFRDERLAEALRILARLS